jgi:two-component system, NtrC family, response regulator HydG
MSAATAELLSGVVAVARPMREVLELVARLSGARSPVLIDGESGTGKDLVAHLIHYGGPRRDGPFIRVHCPSIPEELLESELFGHERGAFTDAQRTKLGKLELASGGTLYFDQIHDLAPRLQAKLLRVVEEKSFERVGGTRTLEADVRFIASVSVDLRRAVSEGTFREDLYHRLSVVPVHLPPLRERRSDVPPLVELFLRRERERRATPARGFADEALAALCGYRWPGNVRELRSSVERAVLLAGGERVLLRDLPAGILAQPTTLWEGRERKPSLRDVERDYIRYVLEQTGGSQTQAAEILGISRKALWQKRRRFGLP